MEQIIEKVASSVNYQDDQGRRLPVLPLLYDIPAIAALEFRSLDPAERLLVAQAVQHYGLVQLLQIEAGPEMLKSRRDVSVDPERYLAGGLTEP